MAEAAARQCGECGLCCKVVAVAEFDKPAGVWCPHYAVGKGCTTYETRPDACRAFRCLWLDSAEFGEAWFPKRAGFFLWEAPVPVGRRLIVEVDQGRPEAWKREPYLSQLRDIATRAPGRHIEVLIRAGRKIFMLFPEGVVDLGPWQEKAIQSGYQMVGGRMQPFARYV